MMQKSICLNADIGELPGAEGRDLDIAILEVVTRCSIACGGHAGDEASMTATIRSAMDRGVLIGAHPSYPDRAGFGRTRPDISYADLAGVLKEQVSALSHIASGLGAVVSYIKPHGALYNDAAKEDGLAQLVAEVCRDTGIANLIGPPGSALESAAIAMGLLYLREGFADRSYEPDGSLTPRSVPGSVIHGDSQQEHQALMLALEAQVRCRTGLVIEMPVQTICLHGDTPGAARSALRIRDALERSGVCVKA